MNVIIDTYTNYALRWGYSDLVPGTEEELIVTSQILSSEYIWEWNPDTEEFVQVCECKKMVVEVDSAHKIQGAIEAGEDSIIRILPGTYYIPIDCKDNPIVIPNNCIIQAYGAELIFRFTNSDGYWGNKFFQLNNVKAKFIGGKYWIDRVNSVESDARRLFSLQNGAHGIFRDCKISNNSGREGIVADNDDTELEVIDCFFKPQQNTFSDNEHIYISTGAIGFIHGCIFDGMQKGQEDARLLFGVELCPDGYTPMKVSSCIFRNAEAGIQIRHSSRGHDNSGIHISDCEFLDIKSSSNIYPIISFSTKGGAEGGYNLYDTVIENCKFRGGSTNGSQIGTRRYDTGHSGIKGLVLRNLDMCANGKYGAAKYGIDFNEVGSGETLTRISEISGVYLDKNYGTEQINIHEDIEVSSYDVILEE